MSNVPIRRPFVSLSCFQSATEEPDKSETADSSRNLLNMNCFYWRGVEVCREYEIRNRPPSHFKDEALRMSHVLCQVVQTESTPIFKNLNRKENI
ncbi:hypothetical protein NPIL_590031 [Nephila pilipes]|uniref:Uncharacterized protein n=1 Tax=Nephila pilipes TaxID=299642 RepID=A0A8X6TMV8_NEPPI|nr:hypothetical protein NPIL_590031 [Nephila pilipes]